MIALVATLVSDPARAQTKVADVVAGYSDIAQATYQDSLVAAQGLLAAVNGLVKNPTPETLQAARQAWLAARVPYMQTEVFRFGNKIVDEWEGRVNAWPLDEGLIDYVAPTYGTASDGNPYFTANVIANTSLVVGRSKIDARRIDATLLSKKLHEAGKIEANVATGYHAVEFLLWGQDLSGAERGAGKRPASDFDTRKGACTNGNCDRRARYLVVATELLVSDMRWMVAQWQRTGAARKPLARSEAAGLAAIFKGLGSLAYGELAGERMKLGLLLHDPEEEHDCFSDNTHNSHYYNVQGIQNIYLGQYKRTDGKELRNASLSDLVREKSPEIDQQVRKALTTAMERVTALKARAETKESYDQMIGENNPEGNAAVQRSIDALVDLTKEFERAISVLGLKAVEFESSDSLVDPANALAKKK